MKHYIFTFIDAHGNHTNSKTYSFDNITEARTHAKNLLGEAMDGTMEIKVRRYYRYTDYLGVKIPNTIC